MARKRQVATLRPIRHKNGLWYAYLGEAKNGRATPVYAPRNEVVTEAQAWKWLEARKLAMEASRVDGIDPTFFGLCQLYLAWVEDRVAKGLVTRHHYQDLCSVLTLVWDTKPTPKSPALKDYRARLVTPSDIEAAVEVWRESGYSAHYIDRLIRSTKAAYNWGRSHQAGRTPPRLLPENPIEDFKAPRLPKSPDRFVEPVVIRRFMRWAWGQARQRTGLHRRFDRLFLLMFRFCYLTGARPGEACKLTWAHVDREKRLLTLPPELHKTGKKTGEDRVIHATGPVLRLLSAIERLEEHHQIYIFTHRRAAGAIERRGQASALAGEPWPSGSASSAKMRKLRTAAIEAKVAGVQAVGPKKLLQYTNRHVYASRGLMAGMTNSEVAELLGNSPEMIDQVYGHIQLDHTASLAESLVERRKRKPVS